MKYIIDEEDLYELISASWELNNLYNYGVDNWEGYGEIDGDDEFTEKDVINYIKENFKTLENIRKNVECILNALDDEEILIEEQIIEGNND